MTTASVCVTREIFRRGQKSTSVEQSTYDEGPLEVPQTIFQPTNLVLLCPTFPKLEIDTRRRLETFENFETFMEKSKLGLVKSSNPAISMKKCPLFVLLYIRIQHRLVAHGILLRCHLQIPRKHYRFLLKEVKQILGILVVRRNLLQN